MGRAKIAILSGQSLFAEGFASRLAQFAHEVEFEIFNPQAPGTLTKIQAFQPAAVILDATETKEIDECPLSALLTAFPSLKIVRLNSQKSQVQIVTSEQYSAGAVRELLEIIAPHSLAQS